MKLLITTLLFLSLYSFAQIESFDGYKSVNGTSLYLKIIAQPFKSNPAKREPLLIVHGGPGLNHTYLLPHLKKLSKQYTLIFYDQRASGRSFIPSADSVSLKLFSEDIEGIRQALGIEKLLIFCHSWGAVPSVQYALDFPDRVKGLILCNPVALSHDYDNITREAQMLRFTGRDSTNRSIIIGSPDFKAGKADAYRRLMLLSFQHSFSDQSNFIKLKLELQDRFKQASQVLNEGLSKDMLDFNYYGAVQRFKFPVLILHGRGDVIPLRASENILQSIPNSRLSIFRNSGHFIFIEEPKKFYSVVVAFTRLVDAGKK
jgi:proline iminopeptidase